MTLRRKYAYFQLFWGGGGGSTNHFGNIFNYRSVIVLPSVSVPILAIYFKETKKQKQNFLTRGKVCFVPKKVPY